MNETLSALVEGGYGEANDLNCAETILWGANQVYDLGLEPRVLRLASGFGGGMGIEATCGALTGALMVLGLLFTRERGHQSPRVKELCVEFLEAYRCEMGSIDCRPLKDAHRTEELKCRPVVHKAALLLERLIARELRSGEPPGLQPPRDRRTEPQGQTPA